MTNDKMVAALMAIRNDVDNLIQSISITDETPSQPTPEPQRATFSPTDLMALWNQWAEDHGKSKIVRLAGKRLKSIQAAMKEFPKKEDWQQIFKGVENDDFFYKIMDFDKLYRNEKYFEFFEKASQAKPVDSLKAFFDKHVGSSDGN
jgi:hypothetical protein